MSDRSPATRGAPTIPDAGDPHPATSHAGNPDAANPDAADSNAASPATANPDAAGRDTSDPDTANPDTRSDDRPEPDATRANRRNEPIRVLVVDDQALLRGSFRVLVETAPGLVVVGEAGTGAEAVAVAADTGADVVLMDIRMPEMDGIEATRRICSGGRARVLILTMFDLDAYVYAALRAGASGFLLKDTPPADLLAAIRVVAGGDALLAPGVTRRLIAEFASRPAPATAPTPDLVGTTDREREVLTLVGRGLSNAEIAAHLHLSPGTVKTHVSRLLSKLGARDRAQLVIVAYETGLVATAR